MSETIIARFYNSWVPETWLTPTLTARDENNNVLLNAVTMDEVGDGYYKYDWADYDKTKLTLFSADGGATLDDSDRYLWADNMLDAYPNKNDWKWQQQIVIDWRTLRKKVRDTPIEWNTKKWTFGEILGKKLNVDFVDEVKWEIWTVVELVKNIKIPEIDIPKVEIPEIKNLTIEDIHNALDTYKNKEQYHNVLSKEDLKELSESIFDKKDIINPIINEINIIPRLLEQYFSVYKNVIDKDSNNTQSNKEILKDLIFIKFTLQSILKNIKSK